MNLLVLILIRYIGKLVLDDVQKRWICSQLQLQKLRYRIEGYLPLYRREGELLAKENLGLLVSASQLDQQLRCKLPDNCTIFKTTLTYLDQLRTSVKKCDIDLSSLTTLLSVLVKSFSPRSICTSNYRYKLIT